MRRLYITIMLTLLLICTGSSFASMDFVSSEIDTGNNRQGYWTADMNGDLLHDIIIATWSESIGREFLIYTQEKSGKFSDSPWRRIEIKKDIIAFALADLRPAPGKEFVFFTRSACFSLSSAKKGYANNLKKLFEWELIKSVPDKKTIDFIGELKDLNGDTMVDMLLPGQKQYTLFMGQPNEVFTQLSTLPTAAIILNKKNQNRTNLSLTTTGFSTGSSSIYENMIVQRLKPKTADKKTYYPPILSINNWISTVSTGRFNSDELVDFVYLDDVETTKKNTKQLNIIYQPKTGKFPSAPHWQANVSINGNIKMMDINGDHLTDLITTNKAGTSTNILHIYLNQEGQFDFNKPSYVMKLSGVEIAFHAIDYNQDGFPELVISSYSVSAVKAITSGSVTRKLLIYAGKNPGDSTTLFDRRPSSTYEEAFAANEIKGLIAARSFSGDIDGDGIKDVVSLDKNGALTATRINQELQVETEPFLSFVPMHFIVGTRLVKLNQDKQTDIIIEHQHALTLLTSQGVRK